MFKIGVRVVDQGGVGEDVDLVEVHLAPPLRRIQAFWGATIFMWIAPINCGRIIPHMMYWH
jgi:hypothetical protein